MFLFLIELISWFIFINIKVFFVYNFGKIYYVAIFLISLLALLFIIICTYKKIKTFRKKDLIQPFVLFTVISSGFFLITGNISFDGSDFNERYEKINVDMRTMYSPKEHLNGKKSDSDKLKYVYDLHLYNLDDYSTFINIPFIVNYQIIIDYDKSLHYNMFYNPGPRTISFPFINRYLYNNAKINQYEEGKGDFYITMEKIINEYFIK